MTTENYNFMRLNAETGILNDLPDWCKSVPYQIKSIAIKVLIMFSIDKSARFNISTILNPKINTGTLTNTKFY